MTADVFAIKKIRNEIVLAGLNHNFDTLRQTLKRLFNSLVKDHLFTKEAMVDVVKDLAQKAPLKYQDPAVILAQAVVEEVAAAAMVAYATEAHRLLQEKKKLQARIAEIDKELEEERSDRELFYYSEEALLNYGKTS